MSKDVQSPQQVPSQAPSQAPSRLLRRRVLVGALVVVVVLGLIGAAYEGFEQTIWHMNVDGYTFTGRNAAGRVLAHVVSHDAQAASALRQRINNQPSLPTVGPFSGAVCMEPAPPGPIASYFYDFLWRGRSIETVWDDPSSCGAAWAAWVNCGGVTILVSDMPIIPKGVRLTSVVLM